MAMLQVLLTVIFLLPCSIAYSGFNCDCYPSYYTCFDVTKFGLDAFPLFGQPVDFFELDIGGVLKGYTANDYYYEHTKLVPYLLDDAVIGSVSCIPAMTDFDSNGLLPFIAAAASNTTVLAKGFADFIPTAAIEFYFENILTWKQALRLLNKTVFHPRVDGLEELLMNMTDIYSDLKDKLPSGFTFENVTDYPDFPVITRHIIDHYGDGPIDISDVDTTPYNFVVALGTNGTHTVLIYDYYSANGSLAMLPLGAIPTSHFPGAFAAFQYPPGNYYPNTAFVFQGSATIPGVFPEILLNQTNGVQHDDTGSLITGAFVFRVDELSCFQEDEYFCVTDYPRHFSLHNVTVDAASFTFVEEYFEDLNITYTVQCSGPPDDLSMSATLSINFFSAHQMVNSSVRPIVQGGLFNQIHVVRVTGLQRNTEYNCTLVKRFDNGEFSDILTPQVVQVTTLDVPCPCLNGGMCLPGNYTSLDEITCSCQTNSTGEFCQLVCPCVNGGICNPMNFTAYNETMCVCPDVYIGDLCEKKVPCPCINGGVCLPDNFTTFSEIMCSCPENYTGERCQWLVCPCMNSGVCNPENFTAYNETVCSCPEVYTGDLCENRVPCPCENGGGCVFSNFSKLAEVECTCGSEFTGRLCQTVVFQANHMGSIAAGVLGGVGGLLAVVVLLVVFLVVFRLQRKKRKEDDNAIAIEMHPRTESTVL